MKVLIVEDNDNLRLLLEDNLTFEGFETSTAATGAQALSAAAQAPPDAAIVDLGLPDMSGWDVCRRLRADPRTAKALIVILTAESPQKVLPVLRELGLEHYFAKPYDPVELGRQLRALVSGAV